MTNEQIAVLREQLETWHETYTDLSDQHWRPHPWAAPLLRLLEERRRLLAGLKDATNAIIGEWGQAEDLEAIIAYAEEAAP